MNTKGEQTPKVVTDANRTFDEKFDHLTSLIRQQVEDAEANLVYAERQYHRAKRELDTAKASYERICADDLMEKRRKGEVYHGAKASIG